jgi:hypothetical protein
MSLGNDRPALLREVEKSLWRTLLRIASGLALGDEMGAFLEDFSTLSDAFPSPAARGVDWFAAGE